MKIRLLESLFILPRDFLSRWRAQRQAHDVQTIPSPIVIAASQDWDGNDGPWSSFPIQIGSPAQNFKVFVSTSAYETTVILPGGCIESDPSNCPDLRGGDQFMTNESTTWVKNTANLTTNIYPIDIDTRLGYNGKAALGFDDVTLGWQGAGGPALKNQTVGGFITKDFYLGYLGLSPRAANFTNFDDPIPSFMQNLVNKSMIPSTSWSYTAGNQYRLNQVLGSLVLGGYDASKFIPNSVSFQFNSEDIRDLTVQLELITMSDSKSTASLLPSPIPSFVDSSQPSFWLPIEACSLFEKAFGLMWDEKTELYLLNSTQRAALLAQNASITFTLGNLTAGANVNITLPYKAFDLDVSSPIVSQSTSYFPLKRAANDTQYTLGRTFLQEAYVTADYDRGHFSVSQCSWVAGAQQSIVPILPPTQESLSGGAGNSSSANRSAASKPLPIAAIAGGAGAGGVLLAVVVGVLVYFFCIKPRRRQKEAAAAASAEALEGRKRPTSNPSPPLKAELDNAEIQPVQELDGYKRQWMAEVDGSHTLIYELDGKKGTWAIEADGKPVEIHEMPAVEEVAHEMRGQRDSLEIAPPRPSRWSWETGEDATVVGSSRGLVARPQSSVVSPPTAGLETSPRPWRVRLARLPE